MKRIIFILLLASTAYGQTPTYTPMRSFYEYKGIKMDTLFLLPTFSDTNSANLGRPKTIDKSIIMAGTVPYVRDLSQSKWVAIGGNNFATADLTATGDRLHDFAGNTLTISNLNNLGLQNFNTNYSGGIYLNNTGPKLNAGVYPTGMLTRINMDTSFVEILSNNSDVTPTVGSKILVDTNYVQFQYLGSPAQYYYFPNTSPTANTVMGYTSANTLGWVDIEPAFDAAVDLSTFDYTASKWGVFTVTINSGTQVFIVPDPSVNKGKYITIINTTASDVTLGGSVIYPSGNISTSITTIGALDMLTAYSDGSFWFGFIQ